MPTRITLIRHGETDWNKQGRWQGHAIVPLNEEGRQQAVLLAEHLLSSAQDISAIYTSDLLRARETATIIAQRLGKTVILDQRLREIDLGEWQGLTTAEIRVWDKERFETVMNDPVHLPRPGGESVGQVADRAFAALEEYAARHVNEHILVVSHGGTIRNVLDRLGLLERSLPVVGNTSQSMVIHTPGDDVVWKLDLYNLMTHLDSVQTEETNSRGVA